MGTARSKLHKPVELKVNGKEAAAIWPVIAARAIIAIISDGSLGRAPENTTGAQRGRSKCYYRSSDPAIVLR